MKTARLYRRPQLSNSRSQLLAQRLPRPQEPNPDTSRTDSRRDRKLLSGVALQSPFQQSPITLRTCLQHPAQIDRTGVESVRGLLDVFERHGDSRTEARPVQVSGDRIYPITY